jgi:Rho-binding antiterminator
MLVNTSISCEHYDYIEIACLYAYEIEIQLKSGETISGVAKTTCVNVDKAECIEVVDQAHTRLVMLNNIKHLRVVTEFAKFKEIEFS